MLFSKIYNWIKYKTLPSSFLFKNRLYVERDSKHRKILFALGTTFRNSKWRNFTKINIKNTRFVNFISYKWCLILTILVYAFTQQSQLVNFAAANYVSFWFWMAIDSFDYYIAFAGWLLIFAYSTAVQLVAAQLTGVTRNKTPRAGFDRMFSFRAPQTEPKFQKINFLAIMPSDANILEFSEMLFEKLKNDGTFRTSALFYKNLYATVFWLNSVNEQFDACDISAVTRTRFASLSERLADCAREVASLNSTNLVNASNASAAIRGQFYMTNFDLMTIAGDDLLLKTTGTQLNQAKWNRWLYKYSMTNRRDLKTANKMTFLKKKLNSLNFATIVNHGTGDNGTIAASCFSNLAAIENSYFWYLKRSYLTSVGVITRKIQTKTPSDRNPNVTVALDNHRSLNDALGQHVFGKIKNCLMSFDVSPKTSLHIDALSKSPDAGFKIARAHDDRETFFSGHLLVNCAYFSQNTHVGNLHVYENEPNVIKFVGIEQGDVTLINEIALFNFLSFKS